VHKSLFAASQPARRCGGRDEPFGCGETLREKEDVATPSQTREVVFGTEDIPLVRLSVVSEVDATATNTGGSDQVQMYASHELRDCKIMTNMPPARNVLLSSRSNFASSIFKSLCVLGRF